jgi:tetratricopeptide (TPR) repeat protein
MLSSKMAWLARWSSIAASERRRPHPTISPRRCLSAPCAEKGRGRHLKLEVENYPKYWNAYDSLGDAYKAAGQNGLAIANYKRALELNPADDKAMEQRLTPGAPA